MLYLLTAFLHKIKIGWSKIYYPAYQPMNMFAVNAIYLILCYLLLHLDLIRGLLYNVVIYAPDSLGPLSRSFVNYESAALLFVP